MGHTMVKEDIAAISSRENKNREMDERKILSRAGSMATRVGAVG